MPSSLPGSNPFEGVKAEEEEEEEGFVDPELPYQVAEDGKEGDLFNMFPSRADEALKTCKLKTAQNAKYNLSYSAVQILYVSTSP